MWFSILKSLNYVNYESEQTDKNESRVQSATVCGNHV